MRSSFLFSFIFIGLLAGSAPALAQQKPAAAPDRPTSSRLAMASASENTAAPAAAPRLACSKLDGQVLGINGKPLVGATVTVKGTPHLCITNSEGRYLVNVPVYQGQILEIEAAGYTSREVTLADCTAPVVGLELASGTKIKKKGKRAGQIVRFGTADMQ